MAGVLVEFLRNPLQSETYQIKQWETLLRQAKAANLTARIDYLIDKYGLTSHAPARLLPHLHSATEVSNRIKEQTLREVFELTSILKHKEYSFTLLKGAAYIVADMSCHNGRAFSDIDILVSRQYLHAAEFSLLAKGWARTEVDDYDEAYYRKWMHEIPPLIHEERYTVIDLHHNILPPTNADSPSAEKFKTQLISVPRCATVKVLGFEDMLIHSATHLFSESEFHNGLRDLSDIDMMLAEFTEKDEEFTERLVKRAEILGLAGYLYLALRYVSLQLGNQCINSLSKKDFKTVSYHPLRLKLLDFCFLNIFVPDHKSSRDWRFFVAKFLLYLRGHYIRMPLRLLLPHLFRKALITPVVKWKKQRQMAEKR